VPYDDRLVFCKALVPRDEERMTSGDSGEVAIDVTQLEWPLRMPPVMSQALPVMSQALPELALLTELERFGHVERERKKRALK
jgi:hypothetical protein